MMKGRLVSSLLASLAANASSVALIDGERQLSYRELDQLSAELAGGLSALGIGPGDLVGLYTPRGWRWCASVLAIWRLGASVIAIDTGQPTQRAARILRKVAPRLLLSERGGEPLIAQLPERHYRRLHGTAVRDSECARACYAVATSGSTGEPKSVLMGPAALDDLGRWYLGHWQFPGLPHALHTASVGFDVAYLELVTTLMAGARLVVADEDQRRDPFELVELIREHRVARAFLSVSMLHSLAAAGLHTEGTPSLREIIVAGEQLVITNEVRTFCARNDLEVVNEYGANETHAVTQHRLAGDPASWPDRPPIGAGINDTELLRLADGTLRPFAAGEEGELVVAGRCVGLGYLGDPRLTAQKFPELPHSDGTTRRCYLTGDLVRSDGEVLTFLARVDGPAARSLLDKISTKSRELLEHAVMAAGRTSRSHSSRHRVANAARYRNKPNEGRSRIRRSACVP